MAVLLPAPRRSWLRTGLLISLAVGGLWDLTDLASAQPPLDPQAYELNLSKGLIQFDQGRYQEAERLFTQALAANSDDPDAGYYLGQALIRLKNFQAAEERFRQILNSHPTEGRALLGLGMAQYHQGRYQEVLTSLAAAEKILPDESLIYYYQGLAHNGAGTFENAPQRLFRALALSPELAPEVHYQSGVAYYRQGVLDEAKSEFEAVIEAEPQSELARSAREFLQQITEAKPKRPKRWDLSLGVSAQYDSNVVLLPLGVQPPGGATGISKKDDFVTALFAHGEYRLIQTDTWTVGAGYGFYQNFHRSLSSFDVQDHTPVFYVQRQIGPAQVRLQYVFDYVSVGRDPYLLSHAIQPIVTISEGGSAFTQFQFRYQNKDFQDDRFRFNSTRDGKNWLAGVTQYFLFAKNMGNVRLGYTYDTDRTGGGTPASAISGVPTNADWTYTGHRASAGIGLPPLFTIRPDLAVDYYRQDYKNPNSFSFVPTTKRKDDIYLFTGSLSRDLTSQLRLALQYSYTRDQVNIAAFDYARSIVSLTLGGQF